MIMSNMRNYQYYLYSDTPDEYGQSVLIKDEAGEPIPQGTVKLSINITSQGVQDNINYKQANYIGLTYDRNISDKYVIKHGDEMLKVLYVNPKGRLNQVFMGYMK